MLRSIQIKIVLIFLILGIIMISVMGYVNYSNLQRVSDEVSIKGTEVDYSIVLQDYQEQQRLITIYTILIFTLISLLVRNICYTKSYSTDK